MEDIYKSLSEGVKRLIEKKFSELKFDYTVSGKIKTVNGDGSYITTINDFDTTLKAREGLNLQVNDLVYIRVVQGNFSNKFIDCKIP